MGMKHMLISKAKLRFDALGFLYLDISVYPIGHHLER